MRRFASARWYQEPVTSDGMAVEQRDDTGSRGLVEQRGIEYIPESERRGTVRHLGAMWSGVILNVLTVVYGTLMIALGLNWWQAVLAVLIGNLTWVFTGVVSIAGPAAGTTTFGVSRLVYGHHGVRPIAFFNWIMMLGYEVLDLVLGVLAASALLRMAGVEVSTAIQVTLVIGLSVIQAVLPLLGHAAITKALSALAIPCAVIFLIMAWLVAGKVHLGDQQPGSLAMFFGAIAVTASSGALGWAPTAADYSRYLPRTVSKARLATTVALAGGIPQVLLMFLGIAIAVAMPSATDPVSGLSTVFPTWLVVIYLLMVVVQMLGLNAVDLYSSGVTLQIVGLRVQRWQAVLVDSVICAIVGLSVVLSGSFYQFVNNFLLFMIVWFAPWVGVFTADLVRRRVIYPVGADEAPVVSLWSVPALAAQFLGMLASVLCINTTVFVGPLASMMDGADLSVIVGIVVGAAVYTALSAGTTPAGTTPAGTKTAVTQSDIATN